MLIAAFWCRFVDCEVLLMGFSSFRGMQVSAFGGDDQTDTGDYWK
jgi:hypothetical protein